jgi:hypothetical protein
VLLPQPLDRGEQLRALLPLEERRLRRRGRVAGAALLGQAQLEARAAAGRAAAVARLVGDDLEQPRSQRRTLAEAPERAVRLDEGVLNRLLGVGGRSRDDIRGAEGDPWYWRTRRS